MNLIVGLGNPGSKYESTYHNIGFIVVDAICKYWNFQPFLKKADYLITSGFVNRPLSKPIYDKKIIGEEKVSTTEYSNVFEERKQSSTTNLPSEIEFRKGSNDKKVILLKPYSFMNNSGIPVSKVQNFYKLLLDNIIVIHDDADLDLGKIKIKKGGSSGGHNGIKSIDTFISNNYWRLRFGVGRPNDQRSLADHVLSKCSNFGAINSLIEKIAENIHLVLQQDHAAFISKIIN